MYSFQVHDVRFDGRGRYSLASPRKSWEHLMRPGAVLLGCSEKPVLGGGPSANALMSAVAIAYNKHHPLSLHPAAIWMAIGHGLSTWITENAEAVRKQFVAHEGKAKIVIDVPFQPEWPWVLGQFSEKLADYIGKKRDLFVANFSTASLDETAASEVILMHAMSKYFDYGMRTLCGFPRITLEGSVEDWENIYGRVRAFSELGAVANDDHMKKWVSVLLPTLEQFIQTAKGNPDKSFWNSFYQEGGGSGGPYVSGHVVNFFPYISSWNGGLVKNEYLGKKSPGMGGLTSSRFDRGLAAVDVEWEDNGTLRDIKFHGGFVGVSEAEDHTVRPECGWGIIDVTNIG